MASHATDIVETHDFVPDFGVPPNGLTRDSTVIIEEMTILISVCRRMASHATWDMASDHFGIDFGVPPNGLTRDGKAQTYVIAVISVCRRMASHATSTSMEKAFKIRFRCAAEWPHTRLSQSPSFLSPDFGMPPNGLTRDPILVDSFFPRDFGVPPNGLTRDILSFREFRD